MLLRILQGTPTHIWLVLAGLVAFGLAQSRSRTLGARRVAILPVVLLVLSLAGVASSFGAAPTALVAWLAGMGSAFVAAHAWLPRPVARWSAAGERVHVEGSWLPLMTMLAIFAVKYGAGVSLALQPELAARASFAVPFGFAFGFFSGVFAARGRQLWQGRAAAA